MTDIRVVLGDDNVLVREGVRALLDATEGITVVEVASDAPSLVSAADEHRPDVVVTDIKMPPLFRLEGIEAAHEIRARHPDTGVVVLSAHDDEAYALALLGQGHTGLAYLLKDRLGEGDDLARAIREVHAGGSLVDPTIAARLSGRKDSRAEDRELLDLMARGLGYTEMAEELGTTEESVDRRITETFARLAGEADRGASGAVRMLKELHAAVIDREASARVLREFVPSQVAERLGSTPLEPEEVEATILFSDIRGFTTLSERLAPKEVASVLAIHLAAMAEVVLAHGGTIDKFAGDAVMAVFGAPDHMPDHAERALLCALAMQARQAELNDGADLPLEMGIGVNTGVVIAGTVGGAGRLEYTVVGDAVNVAQRLQASAGPGDVVASAETVSAAPALAAQPIGAQEVKGRREPVEVYRLT